MSNLNQYNRRPGKPAPVLRSVPLSVRLSALFGGALQPIGWIAFGFSMIFVWGFGMNADVRSLYQFRGDLSQAEGTISANERTSFSEGGGNNRPGTPIYRVFYSFVDEAGSKWDGVSYTRGARHLVGATAPVEYPAGRPGSSRLVGARTTPFGAIVLVVLLFPLVGLFMALGGFLGGLRRQSLLANGKLARGQLVSKEPTSAQVNRQTVYRMAFEFEAEDGKTFRCEAKTHNTKPLEDEENGELVLYLPSDPRRAYPVDAMPGGVRITEAGEFRAPPLPHLLIVLLPPLLAIAGHGIYFAAAYL